jgi:hypothetical protein
MERTGIEPVASDLQIPDFKARLGQIRSVNAKLRWLREVEIGYSGTRFGTRFSRACRIRSHTASGEDAPAPELVLRDFGDELVRGRLRVLAVTPDAPDALTELR